MKILLVEDDRITLQLLEKLLRRFDHEVTSCTTAEEAWEIYQSDDYRLLFLDWMLPGLSGLDLCRKIRGLPKSEETFIVIVTGYKGTGQLNQILDSGADEYISKPIDFDLFKIRLNVIERQVKNLIARKQSERNLIDVLSKLEKSNDRMSGILNCLGTGTALTDKDGKISFVSKMAQKLCGKNEKELLGRHWSELYSVSKQELLLLEKMFNLEVSKRTKVSLELKLPNKKISFLDVEIQDHPEDTGKKIFVLYDTSEINNLQKLVSEQNSFYGIVGKSRPMKAIYQQIKEVANLDETVLIEGETGTGKELVARAIHQLSNRKAKPFIAVNCAGLTESVLVSQLFGHKRGAFTSAVNDQIGLFEAANGGTIFLDEIGDISLSVQTSLLRVLQEKEITRLGETKVRKVDVRILTATNHDLSKEVAKGNFRADLLYRIRVMRLFLPPLREKLNDIPILVETFLQQSQSSVDKKFSGLSKEAMNKLLEYSWPGNVRELKSAIHFAAVHAKNHVIHITDLPEEISGIIYKQKTKGSSEKEQILSAIQTSKGNRTLAAKLLGLSRATFYRKLKTYDIDFNDES